MAAMHNHDDIHVKIEYPKSDLIFNEFASNMLKHHFHTHINNSK